MRDLGLCGDMKDKDEIKYKKFKETSGMQS